MINYIDCDGCALEITIVPGGIHGRDLVAIRQDGQVLDVFTQQEFYEIDQEGWIDPITGTCRINW